MYRSILVAVENSPADRTILTHVRALASLTGAELLLVHVADGWAARHYDELKLRESEEIKADRAYLDRIAEDLVTSGFTVRARLAMGDPATELVKVANEERVDLIAMSTHGRTGPARWLLGSIAERVVHNSKVPVLLIRATE